MSDKTARIRELNDQLRKNLEGGRIVMTIGVNALEANVKQQVLDKVRAFDDFTPDNDPHGEHDMAFLEVDGERIFFKVDYYDSAMQYHSPDPADAGLTRRVLTIGLASDY